MKRIIVAVAAFLFLSSGLLRADQKKFAYDGWRSTAIGGAWDHFTVATGPVYIDQLDITSGTAGSSFRFFNSTSIVSGGVLALKDGTTQQVIVTTSPVYDTSSRVSPYSIGMTLTNGFTFTTTGGATVTVRWDWLDVVPRGQETKGRY